MNLNIKQEYYQGDIDNGELNLNLELSQELYQLYKDTPITIMFNKYYELKEK